MNITLTAEQKRQRRRKQKTSYMRKWRAANPERSKLTDKKARIKRQFALRGGKLRDSLLGPPTLAVMLRRQKGRDYWRKRTASDIGFKIMNSIRRSLHYFIHTKGMSAFELVGCTPQQFRSHLESQFLPGMTWENYGLNGWHIDHKIPSSKFDLTDSEQQKWCFHYSNLRPAWADTNRSKNAKILPEFEADFLRLTQRFPSMKVSQYSTLTN